MEEEGLLDNHMAIYHCHRCRDSAEHPVLPPCGHLHWYFISYESWKCLCRLEECSECGEEVEDDLFALFVDHGEL